MPETLKNRKSCHKCDKVYDKKLKQCKVCTPCHSITYCGKECQEEDWPRHRDNCVPVRVAVVDKENGKTGLVASKNFKKGETIYTETALIVNDTDDSPPFESYEKIFDRHVKKKVETLSEEQKSQFYKLKVPADIRMLFESCSPEYKIFLSNGLGHLLFLHSSHLNQDFKGEPNAVWFRDDEDESEHSVKIVAIKDISKGEEIKIDKRRHRRIEDLSYQ